MTLLVRRVLRLLVVCLTTLAAPSVAAGDEGPGFGLSFGAFDVGGGQQALELGIDYRFEPIRFGLIPHLGASVTEDEGYYGYVGLRRNFEIKSDWVLTGSLATSLYEPGSGKFLGLLIEFRSGLVVSRPLPSGGRVGIGFYHLSNASVSRKNPGANSLLLRYVFPSRRK